MDGISLLSTYAESLHQASIVDTEDFTTTRCEQLQLNLVNDSSERDTSSQQVSEVNEHGPCQKMMRGSPWLALHNGYKFEVKTRKMRLSKVVTRCGAARKSTDYSN